MWLCNQLKQLFFCQQWFALQINVGLQRWAFCDMDAKLPRASNIENIHRVAVFPKFDEFYIGNVDKSSRTSGDGLFAVLRYCRHLPIPACGTKRSSITR